MYIRRSKILEKKGCTDKRRYLSVSNLSSDSYVGIILAIFNLSRKSQFASEMLETVANGCAIASISSLTIFGEKISSPLLELDLRLLVIYCFSIGSVQMTHMISWKDPFR